jgi:hypothetical protein
MRDDFYSFTHEGQSFRAFLEFDQDMREPWKEHDGHGIVSEWRAKESKDPGEMVLCKDHGRCRFYDFAGTIKLAKKDGWGAPHAKDCPYRYVKGKLKGCKCGISKLKPGEVAHQAAMADFERMRDWCQDRWQWVGVIVKDAFGNETSLWGIETDGTDYLKETARELANDLLREQIEHRRKADVQQAFVGCECK